MQPTRKDAQTIYSGIPTIEYDGDRDEKPWQRVFEEVTRKGTHLYEPVKSVPSTLMVLLLGVYLLLGYLTQLNEDRMPSVVNEVDVARDNSATFSEEAAWRYLNIILGDQPRVSGTRYHLQKTQDLKNLLDQVASEGRLPTTTAWQMVDGDYWLAFALPHVNVYQNTSNLIVLLEGEAGFHSNGTIGTSLLVNCHYDSVPYAMGASDDAIFCAVMVETLAKMSRRQQRFKHNVIFLFNGAEENPLQGSHAFLKHEWARGVTNVVNLDAAGMNGKPLVFQVTDPRLLRAYQRVVGFPSGQSLGEFLFKTGVIPSDTDFRIWRDFGNFHGLDIAFVKFGHVYHTRYDHPDLVERGVLQNAGDMLLALVSELADMEELDTQIEPTAAVYYDFLYAFMVTYSFAAAIAVDVLLAVYALLSVAYYVWLVGFRWSTYKELLWCCASRIASLAGGIVVTATLVAISVATTNQMRYVTQPWVVVPLYWLPYTITAVGISQAFDAWRTKKCGLNRSIRTLQAQAATRAQLAVLLLALTCVSSVTTMRYVLTVPLFLMSTFALVTLTLVRYLRLRAWQHLLLEFCFSLPTAMFMMSLALKLSAILLPTMARTPSAAPDYTIAIVHVGLAIIVTSTVSGIELLFSRKRIWTAMVPVSLACIIIMFIPMSPYRDEGPAVQRHYWFHSEVITYNYNNQITNRYSGVLVTKHDVYSLDTVVPALREKGINLNYRTDFTEDCERYVHCNLPLFRVRFANYLIIEWKNRKKFSNSSNKTVEFHYIDNKTSLLLETGPPAVFTPESSLTVTNRSCAANSCSLQFTLIGPAHNMVTLWPREGINITSWSFASPLQSTFSQLGRPVYVIIHSIPTYSDVFPPFVFTVNFLVPQSQQNQPFVDVSHHAHKIHHPEDYTAEYSNLLNAVPKYFNIASSLSFRKNYEF